MRFIRTEDLKAGMRLAKPIYNKNGILLYERNSVLTTVSIISIHNFGLFGIYILEPAEPVPVLTPEDLEFERLQTVYVYRLRTCIDLILQKKQPEPLYPFLQEIIKNYGQIDHQLNFVQNLRSGDDFMYKHAINAAILVAMMTGRLRYPASKQMTLLTAALLYDIGYHHVPKSILEKGVNLTPEDSAIVQRGLEMGLADLSGLTNVYDFFPRALALMQTYIFSGSPDRLRFAPDADLMNMAQILNVAVRYDQMTAMSSGYEPVSSITAMRFLLGYPNLYRPDVVALLAECIHIMPNASSVDLSTGDKGIVLVENPEDFLRPIILCLTDYQVYDLSDDAVYQNMQVVDFMRTMDRRITVDHDTIKQFSPDEKLKELAARFHEEKQALGI